MKRYQANFAILGQPVPVTSEYGVWDMSKCPGGMPVRVGPSVKNYTDALNAAVDLNREHEARPSFPPDREHWFQHPVHGLITCVDHADRNERATDMRYMLGLAQARHIGDGREFDKYSVLDGKVYLQHRAYIIAFDYFLFCEVLRARKGISVLEFKPAVGFHLGH